MSIEKLNKFDILDSTSNNELLLVYRKLGVYVNFVTGMRTRHRELMWSAIPISTSYSDPYLLVYTEKSIDIYDVLLGVWLQSLPLSRTYPLTADGSISLSHDLDVDQHYSKLIYVTQKDRGTLSLSIREKSPRKSLSTRNVLFRSGAFSTTKPTKPSLNRVVSVPTDYRHVGHIGKDDGLRIVSRLISDEQNNELTSMMRSHSSNENRALSRISHSSGSDTFLPCSYTLGRLV